MCLEKMPKDAKGTDIRKGFISRSSLTGSVIGDDLRKEFFCYSKATPLLRKPGCITKSSQ